LSIHFFNRSAPTLLTNVRPGFLTPWANLGLVGLNLGQVLNSRCDIFYFGFGFKIQM